MLRIFNGFMKTSEWRSSHTIFPGLVVCEVTLPFLPTCRTEDRHMSLINPDLRSRVTPDGAMILDIAADEVITLNATGGYIWARLEEGKTVDQIVATLATETGHDPVVVANDVREFIAQIAEKHLVNL
jgi:hypothetical protein